MRTLVAGAHELDRLGPAAQFDGAYSNLGALNCVPDLPGLAAQVARLLKPGSALVFAIIGRICPWEMAYYASRRDWRRISVRFAGDMVPVGLNKRVVWTRYYAPRRFHRAFSAQFALQQYRGLCLFAPPPYLTGFAERHADWYHRLWRLDRLTAGWPVLRNMGDHFLMVMRRR